MTSYNSNIHRTEAQILVQAPMESPLNLAHTFSRSADSLTKSKKYEEAINCNRKAAECCLQAMSTCESPTLQKSLALQHKAYLSQIERLCTKQQLVELLDGTHISSATISESTQTDSIHSMDNEAVVGFDEDTIYQILRENEDIISKFRLMQESSQVSQSSDKSHKSCNLSEEDVVLEVEVVGGGSSCSASQGSSTQGCQSVPSVEELLRLNGKLTQCMRGLLQELGSTRAEKRQMEEKLGDSQELAKLTSQGTLQFSSLETLPLEVSYPELVDLTMQT